MTDDLDDLLHSGIFDPPEDFTRRVMARVSELPPPEMPGRVSRARERIQWIALLGAGLVGVVQLAAFMFGIWAASAAN
jgi:hypothetical protein